MRVMVTGANGQLGLCLQEQLQAQNIEYQAYSSSELDITNLEAARKEITNFRPDAVINTAAYTQVDKAESEPEKAYTVNCTGAENLAVATKEIDSILLHVSTDYVFDGTSTTPYKETDTTNPQCVYGLTKLQGEQAIAKVTEKYIILRTAWVFSEHGSNFVKTMVRLGKERESLSIVNDQFGCPTYATDIATALIKLAKLSSKKTTDKVWGIYHYCGDKPVSWFDFAQEIFNIALENKTLTRGVTLKGIPSSDYPTPAARPEYSVLDCKKIQQFSLSPSEWSTKLEKCIS